MPARPLLCNYPMRRKTRKLVPTVYRALLDLSTMRQQVTGLRGSMPDADTARFLARLDAVEGVALQLLDRAERGHDVTAH